MVSAWPTAAARGKVLRLLFEQRHEALRSGANCVQIAGWFQIRVAVCGQFLGGVEAQLGGLIQNTFAAGADDDINAVAETRLDDLGEVFSPFVALIAVGVTSSRRGIGDRAVGNHSGCQAVFLGVLENRLERGAVQLVTLGLGSLGDDSDLRFLARDDRGHAGGGVGVPGRCRGRLGQAHVRHGVDVESLRRSVSVDAGCMDGAEACAVTQEEDNVFG